MKIGDKVPVVLQVVRAVAHGESVMMNNQVVEVSNPRGNKFWAAPIGSTWPLYMVCDDGETRAGTIRRRAIVDLIECGVAG